MLSNKVKQGFSVLPSGLWNSALPLLSTRRLRCLFTFEVEITRKRIAAAAAAAVAKLSVCG